MQPSLRASPARAWPRSLETSRETQHCCFSTTQCVPSPSPPRRYTFHLFAAQDRHLDRLGNILRDLRAPTDRVHASTAAAETAAEAAAEAAVAAETAAEAAAEAAVVQRKQAQALEQGGLYVSRGSPPWGAHVASHSSRGEMPRHRQRLATSNQALNATTRNDAPTKREAAPRRDNARVRAKSPPTKLRFDTTPRIEAIPRAPSRNVAVRPRSAEATCGAKTRVQKSTLRERAIRVWWRGLSCGVCFAAGAWARDGHGIFGVLLALAAVCGELVLHER